MRLLKNIAMKGIRSLFLILWGFSFLSFLLLATQVDSSTLPSMTELIAALENAPAVLCSVRWLLIETAQKRSIGDVGVLSPLPGAVLVQQREPQSYSELVGNVCKRLCLPKRVPLLEPIHTS